MNISTNDEIAEGVAKPLAEVLQLFLMIVNALRKQPGFDEAGFRAEIQRLFCHPSAADMQRQALQVLLDTACRQG